MSVRELYNMPLRSLAITNSKLYLSNISRLLANNQTCTQCNRFISIINYEKKKRSLRNYGPVYLALYEMSHFESYKG